MVLVIHMWCPMLFKIKGYCFRNIMLITHLLSSPLVRKNDPQLRNEEQDYKALLLSEC